MKNVTKILTAAVLCAALFASTQRTNALGGNAAFWPGDEANIAAFPAQVNNHAFLQLSGVGCTTWDENGDCTANDADAGASLLFQKDGTTWGFNYGSDDWVNMSWGNGDMGVTVGLESSTAQELVGNADSMDCDANGDEDEDDQTNHACGDESDDYVPASGAEGSDMSVSWGGSFGDIGEFGIHYATVDNGDGDATLGVNWRKDCGLWIFDNSVVTVGDLMADDLAFSADMFSHMDAGGADVMFGWGMDYDGNADTGGITQTAAIGVEADMTGWATLRGGYSWTHTLTCEGTDDCGGNTGTWAWGLGFNWGGLTADMTVDSGLFNDPIGAVTGRDEGGITNSTVTLTYSF